MPVYAWKIFFENAIKMVLIIPSNRASEAQTIRNDHHLASSHRTQWKHLLFISEWVSCIHVWRTPFSVVPIHRTVHHKNESWTDGNSLSRKIQMCSCVKCTWVSGNFSLMLSICQKDADGMAKSVDSTVLPDLFVQVLRAITTLRFEPHHDKTNKMACAPSEDSDQPGHPPSLIIGFAVRMEVAWTLSYTVSASKDSDQTGRMPRLIWVFAGRTCHFVGFVMRWLICMRLFSKQIKMFIWLFYTPAKGVFRGVYCFQHVCPSMILLTSKGFAPSFHDSVNSQGFCAITLIAFVQFCSNVHHTLTIRQCMFDREIGAEGSVLQELCLFVILTIRCLYYDW